MSLVNEFNRLTKENVRLKEALQQADITATDLRLAHSLRSKECAELKNDLLDNLASRPLRHRLSLLIGALFYPYRKARLSELEAALHAEIEAHEATKRAAKTLAQVEADTHNELTHARHRIARLENAGNELVNLIHQLPYATNPHNAKHYGPRVLRVVSNFTALTR